VIAAGLRLPLAPIPALLEISTSPSRSGPAGARGAPDCARCDRINAMALGNPFEQRPRICARGWRPVGHRIRPGRRTRGEGVPWSLRALWAPPRGGRLSWRMGWPKPRSSLQAIASQSRSLA
jgi:hypothetical protein